MANSKILLWFFYTCLIVILFQVFIGGLTRLTGSGLSMTEWKVIAGVIPPLNEADWAESFEKYKTIPQYERVNPNMTLSAYKYIFFWEYFHRMWGRLGFLFICVCPIFFYFKGYIKKDWITKILLLWVLYALQGLLGWFMVYSGLSELIYVSHYRLTAHLILAILIFAYVVWLISLLTKVDYPKIKYKNLRPWLIAVFVVFILQICFGGFMSGLRLSIHYPTWPLMQGKLIPDNLFFMTPWYKNFGENYATIHFAHRNLAYLLTILMLILYTKILKFNLGDTFKKARILLPFLFLIQIVLGVLTLLFSSKGVIPIYLASAHQVNGLLLFSNFMFIWFLIQNSNASSIK